MSKKPRGVIIGFVLVEEFETKSINFGQKMNFQKFTTITWRELVGLDPMMFLDATIIQKTIRVRNQKGVNGVS